MRATTTLLGSEEFLKEIPNNVGARIEEPKPASAKPTRETMNPKI